MHVGFRVCAGLVVVFFGLFSRFYVNLHSIRLQWNLLYLLRSGPTAFAEALEEPTDGEQEDCDGQQ